MTITSQEEQDEIDHLIKGESTLKEYYAGMEKVGDSFVKWISGEPLRYKHFDQGEPNSGAYQNVLQIYGTAHGDDWGTWDDVQSDGEKGFICEWETGKEE